VKEQTPTRASNESASGGQPPLLQRKCGCGDKCGDCEKKKEEKQNVLQRFGGDRAPTTGIPQSVHGVLRSPGRPLDAATRSRMEPRFGFDFSTVRVHADDSAHDSAHDVGALAYTVGQDVAFSSGHYRPGTASGDSLLAHELAHVVQQSGGATSSSSSALESDADRSADLITKSSEHAGPRLRAAAQLSKQPDPTPGKKKQEPKKKPVQADDKQPKKQTSPTTPPSPPKPPTTPPEPVFEIAGKTATHWRSDKQLSYDTKQEAENQRDHLKALRVKSDAPVQVDGKWTFDYYPLNKDEAAAEQKTKATAFPKFDITVEQDRQARTSYLRTRRKCPQGIDAKGTFTVFPTCFPTEPKAKATVMKLKDAHIIAEVVRAEDDRWGIYYKPLTQAEASAAGTAAAKALTGSGTDIFDVETEENKELKTFTYNMKCPKGYKDLGSTFRLTAFILPNESEYPAEPLIEAPGIPNRKFRCAFLYEEGVKLEGTGRALDKSLIHYVGPSDSAKNKDCKSNPEDKFKVVTKREVAQPGVEATVGTTVAVDTKVIPLGTELIIEDVGHRIAQDTGGNIKGERIDIYFGETKTKKQANEYKLLNRKVCRKIAAK